MLQGAGGFRKLPVRGGWLGSFWSTGKGCSFKGAPKSRLAKYFDDFGKNTKEFSTIEETFYKIFPFYVSQWLSWQHWL